MADNVTIKIGAEVGGFTDGAKEVQDSIKKIQDAAKDVGTAAKGLIPADDANAAAGGVDKLSDSLCEVQSIMGLLGIQSQALAAALRVLTLATGTMNTAGMGYVAVMAAMAKATKAFLVSLGPIAIAVLAIAVAVWAVTKVWGFYKDAQERAKKATEDYLASSSEGFDQLRKLEIDYYNATKQAALAKTMEIGQLRELEDKKANDLFQKQKRALHEMKMSEEQYAAELEMIVEERNRKLVLIEQTYNARIKQDAEERAEEAGKAAKEEADAKAKASKEILEALQEEKEMYGATAGALLERKLILLGTAEAEAALAKATRDELDAKKERNTIKDTLKEEYETYALTNGELIKRQLLLAGASEATANEMQALREKIDAAKEAEEVNKTHEKTMEDLTFQFELNTAILEKNVEKQRELNIQKRIAAGLSREQAMAEVDVRNSIEAQTEAITKMKQEEQEQLNRAKEMNQIRKVGLEQLYDQIQTGSKATMSTSSSASSSKKSLAESLTGAVSSATGGGKMVEVLEKILDLLTDVKRGLPLIGVAG